MKTKEITCSSRISVKIKETFYTFEYSETRGLPRGNVNIDLQAEKEMLWEDCHAEVDKQVKELI
jgi:hypothetical protein